MSKQKNLRLDDYTKIRIEDMARDYDLPESRIVALGMLMMDLVMGDDLGNFGKLTVEELQKSFIKRIKTIHNEI